MKLVTLAAGALLLAGTAGATTVTLAGVCGTFSNPSPNSLESGTFVCPTFASLGGGGATITGEMIVYSSDYSNGENTPVTAVTNWSFSGPAFNFSTDTTTSTGLSSSTSTISTGDGLTNNAESPGPPVILAGFYDNAITFGTITVNWSNSATAGDALSTTGYAEVVYVSTTGTTGTPEPGSFLLLGSGLLGAGLLSRKKFADRK